MNLTQRLRNHSSRPAGCDCVRCEAAVHIEWLETVVGNQAVRLDAEIAAADDLATLVEEASWTGEPLYAPYAALRDMFGWPKAGA